MTMPIDSEYQDSEAIIAQIINSKEYVLPSYNAENYISKEFVRELSEREKAILTIRAQSTSELHKLGMSRSDMLRRIDLVKCIGFFQGLLIDEFEKDGMLGNEKKFIICSDGKIYYISHEEFINPCKRCPLYKKCDKRPS